jgi:RNA-directed DNA polymerase
LELHPDKTRLIEFGRFAARDRKARGEGKPETFTFLGFTHYCGQRHKSGTFTRMSDHCEEANGREAQSHQG